MHTGYNYRDYEALLSAAINSKLDQKRRENEKFREDIQNIKISSTSLHDKFDRIILPYLSPKTVPEDDLTTPLFHRNVLVTVARPSRSAFLNLSLLKT